MKIEVTPEMEKWYEEVKKDGLYMTAAGSSILFEAIEKAKNKKVKKEKKND